MAIDTRDRRFSILGLHQPVPSLLADPDGAVGAQDRAMLLFLYHGLALAAPGGGAVLPVLDRATFRLMTGGTWRRMG